jgi:hypothetical protein
MNISSPAALVVSPPESGALDLLKGMWYSRTTTGIISMLIVVQILRKRPHLISDSPAGLSHSWKVKTTYYEAEIPIWIDEIADAEAWKRSS